MLPNEQQDLQLRISKVCRAMQQADAEACLLVTNVNIFYLTGLIYTGFCYLTADGEIIHFVKSPQLQEVPNVVSIRKPEQISEVLTERNLPFPETLLLEIDVVPYSQIQRLIPLMGTPRILNASTLMRQVRSVKTPYEIAQIRRSAGRHAAVYATIPQLFRSGMTDVELQIEIERQMRLHGSVGNFRGYGANMEIFMGSLLVGDNAQQPSPFDFALGGGGTSPIAPLGANGTRIERGHAIMVDMAGNYGAWMTDMTRTFSVGKLPEQAYKAHQVSMDIHHKVQHAFAVGMSCAEVYQQAYTEAEKADLLPFFMGTKQQAKFVGHGLGLEINEPPVLTPRSNEMLVQNTVFALEPKFVIPSVGAVGIENTYLVTDNGLETITLFEENIIDLEE